VDDAPIVLNVGQLVFSTIACFISCEASYKRVVRHLCASMERPPHMCDAALCSLARSLRSASLLPLISRQLYIGEAFQHLFVKEAGTLHVDRGQDFCVDSAQSLPVVWCDQ
jgi:hypothetical protein